VRRQSDDVTEAARRRLELLRRELSNAGIEPASQEGERELDAEYGSGPDTDSDTPHDTAAVVTRAGRHARGAPTRSERASGWLDDRLPPTLRGRVGLSGRDLLVLTVVVVLGLGLAAYVVVRSRGHSEVLRPPASSTTGAAPSGGLLDVPSASVPAAGAPSTASPSAAGAVTVDVAGKVRRPGVVTLPAGSRVIDALRRAGGARGHVDLSGLNLARVLTDGEQILVGRIAGGVAASAAATPGAPAGGPLVDINTANQEQLEQLPGVGPVTAQKILAWRSAHGTFSSVDELLEVDGIGEKTLADLAPYVTL
jgi:competence protein ComEA